MQCSSMHNASVQHGRGKKKENPSADRKNHFEPQQPPLEEQSVKCVKEQSYAKLDLSLSGFRFILNQKAKLNIKCIFCIKSNSLNCPDPFPQIILGINEPPWLQSLQSSDQP